MVRNIERKLNTLDHIMDTNERDSMKFQNADDEYGRIMLSKIPFPDYVMISKVLNRKLTNKDVAKAIVGVSHGESIPNIFNFPIEAAMAYEIRKCRESTGMSQSQFANHYNIEQSKLSRMESGKQKIDMRIFKRILRSLNRKFVIA